LRVRIEFGKTVTIRSRDGVHLFGRHGPRRRCLFARLAECGQPIEAEVECAAFDEMELRFKCGQIVPMLGNPRDRVVNLLQEQRHNLIEVIRPDFVMQLMQSRPVDQHQRTLLHAVWIANGA